MVIAQMKTLISFFILIVFVLFSLNINAQDLEVIYHETTIYEPPGIEIVFDIEIINISAVPQTVFMVRTIDNLPPDWTSSLCFGESCFAPSTDSVATTGGPFPPPEPGDTLLASVHVVTDSVSIATAYIQVQIGTLHNPSVRTIIDYVATTDPTVDVEEELNLNGYGLTQNYPNPFNPSTQINYNIEEGGSVNLKIYNILGIEVATLVSEYKPAGSYQVSFDGNDLSSGVYIYRLSVNNYTKTRKMILEK